MAPKRPTTGVTVLFIFAAVACLAAPLMHKKCRVAEMLGMISALAGRMCTPKLSLRQTAR
jgi:hypothetical protein